MTLPVEDRIARAEVWCAQWRRDEFVRFAHMAMTEAGCDIGPLGTALRPCGHVHLSFVTFRTPDHPDIQRAAEIAAARWPGMYEAWRWWHGLDEVDVPA